VSTAPVLDEREHVEVFKAAVTAALAPKWRCYGYDDVPGSPQNPDENERRKPLPNIYVLVSLERRFVQPGRLIGRAGRSGWRVSFRGVGRTEDECRWALLRIANAVDELRFSIDGFRSTVLTHESSTSPEWDDRRFSAIKTYTYSL
jgi:hypothetical protein